MRIIWSDRAFIRRQAIEDYILFSFGFAAHFEYVEAIEDWKKLVLDNPNIGKIEPLLVNMRKEYRSYVIAKLTKCIYYVENDFIVVVDWWDTRRGIKTLTQDLQ
jgi:plasmid stabilization system protein ParE